MPFSSKYFQDVVWDISGQIVTLKVDGQKYYVARSNWHLNGAKVNDMVLFQASDKMNQNHRFGRVVSVLKQISQDDRLILLHIGEADKALCFVSKDVKEAGYAFSEESCLKNENCKSIGFHVPAFAIHCPDKLDSGNLPFIPGREKFALKKIQHAEYRQFGHFCAGKDSLAVSVYRHMECNVSSPPRITLLKNVDFSSDENGTDEKLRSLFEDFLKPDIRQSVLKEGGWKYLSSYPETYKRKLLVHEAKRIYSISVKQYLEKEKNCGAPVITTRFPKYDSSSEGDTLALSLDRYWEVKEIVERQHPDQKLIIERGCRATAGVRELLRGHRSDDFVEDAKYRRGVDRADKIGDSVSVLCTDPSKKFDHFINQQILLQSLLGLQSSEVLYEEEDLLGLIGIRFRNPEPLTDVFVQKLMNDSFKVAYEDIKKVDKSACEIFYSDLGGKLVTQHDEETHDAPVATIVWENMSCEHPYHKRIVYVKQKHYAEFENQLHEKVIDARKMKDSIEKMKESESICPYSSLNNPPRVQLDLRRDTYIQLQISQRETELKQGIGLRILRIGPNCHICLMHLNHPEMAFASDRVDMDEFRQKVQLRSYQRQEIITQICWDGKYYAGGSFCAKQPAKKGDYLCIRKEPQEDTDEKKYIWNAHAIVRESEGAVVKFATCTLSQQDECPETGDFVVEFLGPVDSS